jgi:inhibitor of KinA sporulation pathway (predicted exonuclease)
MIRDITKVLCLDTEHTCYEDNAFPPGEQSDIIQIGWCWLMLPSLEITKPEWMYVKPTRSRVSEYCTELTGITYKQVNSAPPLAHVCKTLINKHGTKARPWMTWGYDAVGLQKECDELEVEHFPFSESYTNAQDMASIILGLPLRMGLDMSLRLMGMSFEGRHHQAPDDSYNLARIVKECVLPTEDRYDYKRLEVR